MIDVKETFLSLTKKRYPYGYEDDVIKLMGDYNYQQDEFGNYFYIIKKSDGSYSDTMFTSHLDTVDCGANYNRFYSTTMNKPVEKDDMSVKHVIDGDFIKTDGKTNLGADDKAGTVIMLNLMDNGVPGLYYFFIGEESGCIGSSDLSRVYESKVDSGELPKVNKCISFDRRGYDSVVTHQSSLRCSSDEFADSLSEELNQYGFWFKGDDTGVYTDSAEFTDVIAECTNISCGYFDEHTQRERQDIEFLELLSVVLTKIDWENLTIARDPNVYGYSGKKRYSNNNNGFGGENYDYEDYSDRYSTYSPEYVSRGKSNDNKIPPTNDLDFDNWYEEQKKKNWQVEN